MKYYFFRDINHEDSLFEGKTFHAAGYVTQFYCELGKPNKSGKDLSVTFIEPFEGTVTGAWRSLDEVELFEVAEWEYNELVKAYSAIYTLY